MVEDLAFVLSQRLKYFSDSFAVGIPKYIMYFKCDGRSVLLRFVIFFCILFNELLFLYVLLVLLIVHAWREVRMQSRKGFNFNAVTNFC